MKFCGSITKNASHATSSKNSITSVIDRYSGQLKANITFESLGEGKGSKIHVYAIGLEPGKSYKYHIHELSVSNGDCKTVQGHYNPTYVDINASKPGDLQSYEIGDLSGKWGPLVGDNKGVFGPKTFEDPTINIKGNFGIEGRSIVIHDNSTSKWVKQLNVSIWDI